MSLFIKICGVTVVDDALACAAAGADAIGLNFWPRSPRFVTSTQAALIAAALRAGHPRVLRVGVFVNAPADEIRALLVQGVIDVAQLHGDEGDEAAAILGRPTWKGLRLQGAADLAMMDRYDPARWERLVIDAPSAGYGGSGRRIDEALAALAARRRQVLLAGGLHPGNVREAVHAVRPAGIDVASGVESRPGRKDLNRVHALIAAVRGALDDLDDRRSTDERS